MAGIASSAGTQGWFTLTSAGGGITLGKPRKDTGPMSLRAAVPRLLLLVLIVGAAIWIALHRAAFAPAAMAAHLEGLGAWAPVLFLIVYAVGALLLFPAGLLSMAGGVAFGRVERVEPSADGAILIGNEEDDEQ